jgi:hypothetical protein
MANEYIHVGQEALQIELDTGEDLSAASGLKIKYTKPGDISGEWAGTLLNTTWIKKEFEVDDGELDVSGLWSFWTFATMADGRDIAGKPVQYYIKVEGKL